MSVATPTEVAVFDRIVCGVDGTPESLEGARQAERLRSPHGALGLAAVMEVNAAVHAGFAMGHVLEELETAAQDGLQRAAVEVKPARAHLFPGEPAPGLLDEIERANATLVAVGPRGHNRVAGMVLGGVAARLLHEAPCSVLLARTPAFGEFPSSIIVGVDGSPESLAAAAVARAIAERFGSEYLIVTATGGKRIDLPPIQALSPHFVTDPGRPAEVLAELSKEADLLVVGSRGLHGPRALGSVSERVGHRASSSVLVVRAQEAL